MMEGNNNKYEAIKKELAKAEAKCIRLDEKDKELLMDPEVKDFLCVLSGADSHVNSCYEAIVKALEQKKMEYVIDLLDKLLEWKDVQAKNENELEQLGCPANRQGYLTFLVE